MRKSWKSDKGAIAAAVDAAENSTGHQIMVRIGALGKKSSTIADTIAARNLGVSLLLCVDLTRHQYEVRWARGLTFDPKSVHDAVVPHLADGNVANAVTSLSRLLPHQAPGEELPDVVDDSGH